MNETEAKDFIDRQVFRSLRGYGWVFLIFASVLGFAFGRFAYVIGENAAVKNNLTAYDRISKDFSRIQEEYGRFQEVRNSIENNLASTEQRLDAAESESIQILSELTSLREIDVNRLVGEEQLESLRLAVAGEVGNRIANIESRVAMLLDDLKQITTNNESDGWPLYIVCSQDGGGQGRLDYVYYFSGLGNMQTANYISLTQGKITFSYNGGSPETAVLAQSDVVSEHYFERNRNPSLCLSGRSLSSLIQSEQKLSHPYLLLAD